jgi:anti-sigma B factor antagonist
MNANTQASEALRLGPELTIAQAAGQRDLLLDALNARGGELRLDLGDVTDFDSAGVQLLLAARQSTQEHGHTLDVVAASAAVREGLQTLGLSHLLSATAA